mmetsp:Transcript_45434/g.82176  ORF Transcript_45434/g.82176 Transcript_45434/m.82176 type:complete len:777 (+) Transcript_45434:1-2331(+)
MGTPTRQGVARLVQRRSAGLISSVEFFESLAKLELEADPQEAHNPWMSSGIDASSATAPLAPGAGLHDIHGVLQRGPPSFSLSTSMPQLLTETQAGALLRGRESHTSEAAAPPAAVPNMASCAIGRAPTPGSCDQEEGCAPRTRSRDLPVDASSSVHESMSAVESEPASAAPAVSSSLPTLLTEQQATAIVQQLGAEWKGSSFADLAQVSSAASPDAGDPNNRPSPVAQHGASPEGMAERGLTRVPSRQSSRDSVCSTSLDISLLPPWSCGSVTPCHALGDGTRAASDIPSSPSPRRSLASVGTQQSCNSSFSSFSRRSQRWEHQRAQKREQLRRQCEVKELAECSFRPEVRPHTARASNSMGCTGDTPATRLAAPPPSAARQAARRWREQREEDELRECTFAPDLSQSASSLHLSVRSMSSTFSDTGSIPRPEDTGSKSRGASAEAACRTKRMSKSNSQAFAPAINPIAPHMVCARDYASKNVFSRLSDPHPEWEKDLPGDDPRAKQEIIKQAPSKDSLWPPSNDRNHEKFIDFLERQNHFEEQRLGRLEEVNRCNASPHSPALCTTSRKLVDRSRKRSEQDCEVFLRLTSATSLSPRGASAGPSANSGVLDNRSSTGGTSGNELTFRPQINVASSRRPARSCTELSLGDQQRREARMLELREEVLQQRLDEQEGLFSPNLCTPPPEVRAQSRLRLLEDPDSYLGRVAKGQLTKKFEREVHLQRKAEEELAECTFAPKVNKGAPAFVRQMAESYRSARELERQQRPQQSPRPAWQ